jgi:hypothetical protein
LQRAGGGNDQKAPRLSAPRFRRSGHYVHEIERIHKEVLKFAPERVTVRVIAKIMRAMTFDVAGQANVANVEDALSPLNPTTGGSAPTRRALPIAHRIGACNASKKVRKVK